MKKKRIYPLLLSAALLVSGSALLQAAPHTERPMTDETTQTAVPETIRLETFRTLQVTNGIVVRYHVTDQPAWATVTTTPELYKRLRCDIKGGNLKIRLTAALKKTETVRMDVYGQLPLEAQASSGSVLTFVEPIHTTGSLKLKTSSGGGLKADVTCNMLTLEASGGGYAEVSALSCHTLQLEASSGGAAKSLQTTCDGDAFVTAQAGGVVTLGGTIRTLYGKAVSAGILKAEQATLQTADVSATTAGKITLKRPADYQSRTALTGKITLVP